MPILNRRCTSCTHEFEILWTQGKLISLDTDQEGDAIACSKCWCKSFDNLIRRKPGHNDGTSAGTMYPIFNRGLGCATGKCNSKPHPRECCFVQSKQHEDQILKARGLARAGDTRLDWERQEREDRAVLAERHADRQAYNDEIENNPIYAEFRRTY